MVRIAILVCLLVVQGFLLRTALHTPTFSIAFLDVGQGDATYIRAENGNDILIDGGASRQVLGALASQMPFSDRKINVVIATHPDTDHIGGLPYVFERYAVEYFIDPGVARDTKAYKRLLEEADEAKYVLGRKGAVIELSPKTHVEILFPDREIVANVNNSSVVALLHHNDKKILLMGDAGKEIERFIQKEVPDIDILKVGHHGSNTSTDIDFVDAITPEYAIISAGEDNRYGHPHEEVLAALSETKILGTYDRGTIVFEIQGKELLLK